jgi:hypothetical protein
MAESHHVIPQIRIAQRVSALAIKAKQNRELTAAEQHLLDTPLSAVLDDRRNQVRLKRNLHHRAHHGANPYRLKRKDLPRGIHDFAEEYALEGALDRELRLIDAE